MADHPTPLALESFAAGEDDGETRAHVEGCTACRAHVDALAAAIGRTPAAGPFLAEIRARATATATTTTTTTATVRSLPRRAVLATGLIALAASLLLFLRPPDETTTLKGHLAVAVIVDRGGVQERVSGTCKVRPGDRLRIELTVASPGTFTAGVLTREGEWLELEPPGTFDTGTHLSRSSLRVDAAGLAGLAIVGEPAAVALARQGRPSSAVAVAVERDFAK